MRRDCCGCEEGDYPCHWCTTQMIKDAKDIERITRESTRNALLQKVRYKLVD